MIPELDALLSADEEGRARIEAARAAARHRLETLTAELESERQERTRALERSLEGEIASIQIEANREAARRRERRAAYGEENRRRAERLLPLAAETFVAILRDGPPRRKP